MRRRGAKRKQRGDPQSSSQQEQQPEENHKPPSKTAAASRAKPSKPDPEPEYFEDQRNLEDLWKQTFPVGTEWDQLDALYQFNWNFSNLEDEFEEGGKLHGQKVYLFGCTEPQLVSFKGESKIIYIPAVVAVRTRGR